MLYLREWKVFVEFLHFSDQPLSSVVKSLPADHEVLGSILGYGVGFFSSR